MRGHMNLLMEISFGELEYDLIDVAPAPVFTRLERLNNRVVGCVEMLGSMLILRGVATADMATDKALTQMYPCVSDFQAVLAAICARCDLSDLVEMCTLLCHQFSLPTPGGLR